jgi:hypothetical protein
MEEYLSKNRTNRRLQKPDGTVFNGLTRLNFSCHRRTIATIRRLTISCPDLADFKKPFKSKILSGVKSSVPFSGKHCCARRK